MGEGVQEVTVELARSDPFQFLCWSLGLVGARATDIKKGADQGIDGEKFFHEVEGGKTRQMVLSVKAGHITSLHVRELRGVVEREDAALGALICMREPTKAMRTEAASAGWPQSLSSSDTVIEVSPRGRRTPGRSDPGSRSDGRSARRKCCG